MTGKRVSESGLTEARLRILNGATYHPGIDHGRLGVVRQRMVGGFEAVTEKRNIQWLCGNGYLEPSNHGDWYLTDKGAEAIAETPHSQSNSPA